MNTLFILNDGPYGTERSYNGLRLARALSRESDQVVRVFLIGDTVAKEWPESPERLLHRQRYG